MRGYKSLVPTTENVTFRVTPEEKAWLLKTVRKLQREGDYCMSDVCRAAFARFQRAAGNGGRRWLIEEINKAKGGAPESGRGNFGLGDNLAS